MLKLIGLLFSLCALQQAAESASCGTPDARHPPALRLSGDTIVGLRQGIVGGKEAQPHSYPWHVGFDTIKCGGAIVGEYWVATAAHCVWAYGSISSSAKNAKVIVGAHYYGRGTQTIPIKRIHVHPDYNGTPCRGIGNDIALIQLSNPIFYSDKVKPICLPQGSDDFRRHGNVLVSGWGYTHHTSTSVGGALRHVVVPTAHSTCTDERISYGPDYFNGYNEMCAGADNIDSCPGDSGGPLMVRQSGRYVLAGIVSCGGNMIQSCGNANRPGVYTHVPNHRQWIDSTMASGRK